MTHATEREQELRRMYTRAVTGWAQDALRLRRSGLWRPSMRLVDDDRERVMRVDRESHLRRRAG